MEDRSTELVELNMDLELHTSFVKVNEVMELRKNKLKSISGWAAHISAPWRNPTSSRSEHGWLSRPKKKKKHKQKTQVVFSATFVSSYK